MRTLVLLALVAGLAAAAGCSGDGQTPSLSADELACDVLGHVGSTAVEAQATCSDPSTPLLAVDRKYNVSLYHDVAMEHNCFNFQVPQAGTYLFAFDRDVLPSVEYAQTQPVPTLQDDGGTAACATVKKRTVVSFPAASETYGIDLLPTSEDPSVTVVVEKMN